MKIMLAAYSLAGSRRFHPLLSLVIALAPLGRSQQSSPGKPPDSGIQNEQTVQLDVFNVVTSKDEGYLSQNTLSGNRVSLNLMKVPQTIQIVNQQLLQDLNVLDDVMPALELASASIVRRSFNPGDDQFIWGFRVSGTLRDGLPTFSNALTSSYDIDRVEVVKGPSAMIFGQFSAVGGVINYVTKKPSKTRYQSLKGALGSYDYRSLEYHAGGPITDKFRFRADVGGVHGKYSARKFAFYENAFVGGAIDYDISANSRLNMDYSYYTIDYLKPFTMMDPRINGKALEAPDSFSLNEPWARHPTKQHRASATFTTVLGADFTARTLLFYSNARNDWLRDQMNTLDVANHTGRKISQDFSVSNHVLSLVSDFVKELKTGPVRNNVNFGLDIRNEINRTNQTNYLLTNTYDYLNPTYSVPITGNALFGAPTNQKGRGRFAGIYAMDQLSVLDDRLSFVVGARFNDQFSHVGAPAPSGTASAVTNAHYTAPRYGVIVRPFEFATIYYNYSESFSFNTGVDYLNRPRVPSVGENKEFGAKLMLLDGSKWAVNASVAIFELALTNVTVTFTQGPGDPVPGIQGVKQDGRQTNKGYDLYFNLHRKFDSANLNLILTAYHGDSLDQLGIKPVYAVNNTHSALGMVEIKRGSKSCWVNRRGRICPQGTSVGPELTIWGANVF